uniref:Uncharacterized protein n=1 Tax=Fagus sylvatica TaxID=28930 RepID=A0A2N9IYD9_FAGSY
MSLETRASKHPIEQPPQPLDRSSLDLQNPERSSSLEAPCALTRHWSSQLSYPRATTRGRATRDPSHHDRCSRHLLFRHLLRSRPPPTDRSSPDLSLYGGKIVIGGGTRLHMSMGTLASLFTCCRGLQTPELSLPSSNSIQKAAPPSEFSPADLPFGIGIAAIGVFTRLHVPSRLLRNSLIPATYGHAAACAAHATTLLLPRLSHVSPRCASHVSSRCAAVSSLVLIASQRAISSCHVARKKKE